MADNTKRYGQTRQVAIIGSGIMGTGIAEIMAAGGLDVFLFDQLDKKAREAKEALVSRLQNRVERGKIEAAKAAQILDRINPVNRLEEIASADLVVEAIVEDLTIKRDLVVALEAILPAGAIIATNTSSLSVTAIAAGATYPERIAGFHFFNPVPLMRVVEVIKGALTDDKVVELLRDLALKVGHRPVSAADTPGFVVNHAGRAYGTEALAIVKEGVADFATIDAILRDAGGFRMGPFELLDLTGLDVSHPVMEVIYNQYYQEPRYRPSVITRQRLDAGLLGRKTGRGFYDYSANGASSEKSTQQAAVELPTVMKIVGDTEKDGIRSLAQKSGIEVRDDVGPDGLVLVGLVGEDLTSAVVRLGLDASNVIGFDPLFGFDTHRTLVASPGSSDRARLQALALAVSDGVKGSMISDSCGTVCQRVLAMIVNIASDMVQQNIASAEDLDAAVRLGLGYPFGPLEWGDRIGTGVIVRILDHIHERTLDPRYRASLWLRRRAELKLPLADYK
ncbi:3-hydroxyacyl-CoA dehydrogenase [Ochrobactrum sp. CM-21-5]|nr:3-hydroxyacyl-CoA dehydrogenase [Ochrobactrum sp. CM-21-5]MBC2887094.1 3-hydroxyacyl-CoA dehydrogenase [Ochrobactrum sp. CM-21-5]